MDGPYSHSPGHRVATWTTVLVGLAFAGSLALAPVVSSATLTNAWQAKIGSAGANGTAKIQAFDSGTGSLTLRLAKLKAAALVPVTLYKGTCSSVGAVLFRLASIKTSSTGVAARTSSLTASQVTLIKKATAATGRIAIRVGSSSTGGVKCGLFATIAVPPPPARVTARITVGAYPSDVAVTSTGVFVANSHDWAIERIDPATNSALSSIDLPLTGMAGVSAILSAEGSLWVVVAKADQAGNEQPGSLLRIDPASGQVVATIPIGKLPVDIAASPGAVWVTSWDDDTITRIDTATNAVTDMVVLVNGGPAGIAYDFGSLWVAEEAFGRIAVIDPATKSSTSSVQTVQSPEGVATGGGAVWVTNWGTKGQPDGVLTRIDPATKQVVRTIPVGINPLWVAYGGGYVWVAMAGENTVVQVNATTNTVQARIDVGGKPMGIAATDHTVWVTLPVVGTDPNAPTPPGTLVRIDF